MKLILRVKKVKLNEPTEFPDNCFDFAYGGIASGDEVMVQYWEMIKE